MENRGGKKTTIISTYISPDELYNFDKIASVEGKTRYQMLKELIIQKLSDPKAGQSNAIVGGPMTEKPQHPRLHTESNSSDSSATNSGQPETSAQKPSTTKSTIPSTAAPSKTRTSLAAFLHSSRNRK